MPTLEQIQVKMKKLQAQAEGLIAKRAQAVLNDIRALMETHGLTTADIDAHGSVKKRVGRPAGKTSAVAGKRKATGQAAAKGKLPAKYRNPKTGETWSGLARSLCCERRRTRPWPRRACLRFRFDRSWTSPVFGAVP